MFESASSVEEAAPDSDVRNPASLLNQDSLIDDEAIVFTLPFVPVYVNPCARLGSDRVPANSDVDEEYVNEARVVVVEMAEVGLVAVVLAVGLQVDLVVEVQVVAVALEVGNKTKYDTYYSWYYWRESYRCFFCTFPFTW